ncbi:MAG: hypothetical protein JKY93_03480 [Gammaproteobacteria bacterium]|nr:hypothetical protein [Gammaproteobacteria bacterium]
MKDMLNPDFDLLDDGHHSLLGTKARTQEAELQYGADVVVRTHVAILVETSGRGHNCKVDDPIGKRQFIISVNLFAGYDLRIHITTDETWLHHKGLKLTSVIATLCAIFYCAEDADPTDPHGILNFKPSGVFGN